MREDFQTIGDRVRRCIRQSDLLEKLGGISRFTLLRWEAEGKFPRRFSIGGGAIMWDLDEVEQFLARSRTAANAGDDAAIGDPPAR